MSNRCVILIGPRACGKTTVAMTLAKILPNWKAIDVDYDFHLKFKRDIERDPGSADGRFYYEGCRDVMLAAMRENGNRILALNGGALANDVTPEICWANIRDCREHDAMVLLLPSRWHFRNHKILFAREQQRSYVLRHEQFKAMYDKRVPILKKLATHTVYGNEVNDVCRKLIRMFNMA